MMTPLSLSLVLLIIVLLWQTITAVVRVDAFLSQQGETGASTLSFPPIISTAGRRQHPTLPFQLQQPTLIHNTNQNNQNTNRGPTSVVCFNSHHDHDDNDNDASEGSKNPSKIIRVYFDIAAAEIVIGRLVFQIPNIRSDHSNGNNTYCSPPGVPPVHTENLLQLMSQSRRSIDPQCHYVGCAFQFSPQSVEGLPQYRWAHVLKGRGRNAVGRPGDRIQEDPQAWRECSHSIYGGTYYGLKYNNNNNNNNNNEEEEGSIIAEGSSDSSSGVVLTVPLTGPGRGSTAFSIVRVAESPPEWKERLLLNSAVLGWLEPSCLEPLQQMARQQHGPPTVVDSGILD